MKHSIDFLPEHKRCDLHQLVGLIRDEVKDAVMIILYGSYARGAGHYVECDERRDFGVKTYYISDYDLLVVTRRRLGVREGTVSKRVGERFMEGKDVAFQTRPQIINESISKLNDALSEGRYFYVDIIAQGVMLYDSGEYRLATPRKLNFAEIKEMAAEYYDDTFPAATYFLDDCDNNLKRGRYHHALFYLHQSTENFIKTIPLVYNLYGYKEHDLEYLIEKCKPFTMELSKVFPRDTEEEERLFKLLQRAYIEARYNKKNFIVTEADIEALVAKIELLRHIVEEICRKRFSYYNRQREVLS